MNPTEASVEIVFVNVNPQATLLLGQARGACVTALVSCDLPVAEYTALQMKQAITGHGRARKSQVQEMVKRLLQLPALPRQDAADALGLAITHAHARASPGRRQFGEAARGPIGAFFSSSKVTISQAVWRGQQLAQQAVVQRVAERKAL
jgi:Holliday junction resolvasome RuvABC endonuclease subunit